MIDGEWSDCFEKMSEGLARIERVAGAEDMAVKTYPGRTEVVLTFEHEFLEGDNE